MQSSSTGRLYVLSLIMSTAHAVALGKGQGLPRAAGADETVYPSTSLYSPTTVVEARNANPDVTSIVETLYSYSLESFPVSGATTYSYTDIPLTTIGTITTVVDLPPPTTSATPSAQRGVPLQGPEGQIGPIESLMPNFARNDRFETVFVARDESSAPPNPTSSATPAPSSATEKVRGGDDGDDDDNNDSHAISSPQHQVLPNLQEECTGMDPEQYQECQEINRLLLGEPLRY